MVESRTVEADRPWVTSSPSRENRSTVAACVVDYGGRRRSVVMVMVMMKAEWWMFGEPDRWKMGRSASDRAG